jgi:5-amino-6-(5-phospho-D-ribitylamino)uracil phosphatase
MAYRMIAIDLDGTLLSPDGTVSGRNKAAVRKALDAGLLVCFATGRNWTESQTVLDAVEHYDTAVFVSGAVIVDTKNRKTLHRLGMAPQLARDVSRIMESLGHAALALQHHEKHGFDYLVSDGVPLNHATSQWMKVTSAKWAMTPSLATHAHEHTIRIGICATSDECRRCQTLLKEHYGERIVVHSLFVPAYDVEVLEVFDPAVNKWQGILQVAEIHGVKPEEIIAIGDDVNDLPMIQNAGLGVAMGNAKDEVKSAAKQVIKPNTEDGLAQFIEQLVDQHQVEPERN